ncbi:MAG: hypothetical protein ABI598_01780 [Chloroflexota bacterium]
MTGLRLDVAEVEALVTDRYLDSLLAGTDEPAADREPSLVGRGALGRITLLFSSAADGYRPDRGVRLAAERLTRDLPRFHPSFRFEERLAARLAEAASTMRLSVAAGGERDVHPHPFPRPELDDPSEVETAGFGLIGTGSIGRPLLVGGAVAASALSLAGAAWVAWRRSRAHASPMVRAARAAHAVRARPAHVMRGRPA